MWLKNSDVAQLSTSGSGSSLRQRYNRQSNLQVNLKARPSLGNPLSHPVMWLSAGFRRRASRLVVWLRACVSAGCCNKHHRLAVYTAVLEAGSLGSRVVFSSGLSLWLVHGCLLPSPHTDLPLCYQFSRSVTSDSL